MLRNVGFFVLVLGLFFSSAAQSGKPLRRQASAAPATAPLSRPKLVVGIVVDQMRWDYLYRYYDRYSSGGFRRLIGEGFSCENTLINYLPSYTAVGHTCIFTGSVPSLTGISSNDWIEQMTGQHQYCTDDSTVSAVGSNTRGGKMSPRNLMVSTVTDELRLATNFRSRVVGVSLKDRASILPAGHAATAAFWFDDGSGNFITSTYYMQQLPAWVEKYNSGQPAAKLAAGGWNTLYPIGTYRESDPDDRPYEGRFSGETTSTFPHKTDEIYARSRGSLRSTPFGNTLTLDFARQAVEGYQLGHGEATDFLTINCASTDYVGHMFGPNSIEAEDTYLRLDKDLAAFFQFLDASVGKGQYLVFLSADHGAAHSIGFSQEHEIPADYWNDGALVDSLNKMLAGRFGIEKLVRSGMNYQISFDMGKINGYHLDFDAIKKRTVEYCQQQPGIAYAVDMAKIGEAPIPEPIKTMMINGYNFKRSGAVQLALNAGWFESEGKTGTTHGSWNPYDTHIPLLFMGWGIQHGSTNAIVNMTDIAPTIASLLHIQMPSGCIGRPIQAVTGHQDRQ